MSDSFSSHLRIFCIANFSFTPFRYTSHTTPLPTGEGEAALESSAGERLFFTSSSSFPQVCRGCS